LKTILTLVCLIMVLIGISIYAEATQAHPNLAQAQYLIDQAYAKITAAQKSHEFDLGGHAAKAKDFLEQATKELKLAEVAADDNAGNKSGEEKHGDRTDEPVKNIGSKHPNLAKAQQLISDAYDRVTAAQKANEFDLGGHAAKAKDFLEQASQELKLAAQHANQ
jgi:uncharacterized protein YxeA